MKTKVLLVTLAISAAIALIAASFVFYVFLSEKNNSVGTVSEISTVSQIDRENTSQELEKDKPENNNLFSIIATGDINIGRQVGVNVLRHPDRYRYPFEKIADIFKKDDIVFSNLEEPITSSYKSLYDLKQNGKIVLRAKPEAIEGFNYAGFNLFSIANNHILDYYDKGLFDTMDLLKKNNIAFAGAGKNLDEARSISIVEKKGVKIGLLAYTDMADIVYPGNPRISFAAKNDRAGVAPNRLDYILEDIKKVRSSVDILIVSLHWGVEYAEDPQPKQIEEAHSILDQGADMIIGHHTHKFQGVEIYKGKPIFYSMGNLLFDQNDPECQQGYLMEMKYDGNKLKSLSGIPYKIVEKAQIVPQDEKGAIELFARETKISDKLKTKCHVENGKMVFDINN